MLDMSVAPHPPISLGFLVADFNHFIPSVFFAVFFSLRLLWRGLFILVCRQTSWMTRLLTQTEVFIPEGRASSLLFCFSLISLRILCRSLSSYYTTHIGRETIKAGLGIKGFEQRWARYDRHR